MASVEGLVRNTTGRALPAAMAARRNPAIPGGTLRLTQTNQPTSAAAQETTSLAYQPSDAAVRLAVETPVAVPQDTVTTGSDDPYRVGTNSVVTGAVVGGIIGGTVVAIHTVGDNTREPLNWVAAVSAPIIGGLVGAGIGLIFR